MIKLTDFLGIAEKDFINYKIHFATDPIDKLKPYKKFLIGAFKEWQEHQTNKNFCVNTLFRLFIMIRTDGYSVVFMKFYQIPLLLCMKKMVGRGGSMKQNSLTDSWIL